jgi:lysophospholipase L1-like esterase
MSARRVLLRGVAALAIAGTMHAVAAAPTTEALPPLRVLLVGDSTMAPHTGYGDALCARFQPNVTCLNLAKGGRSSASYRAEGLWDKVLGILHDGGRYQATYVLIQFGHNDQPGKPGRSTDLATEFPPNMAHYAQQVAEAGATPVLVTPLSRRSFREGVLQNDLRPWAEASIKVAAAEHAVLLDLNADSSAAIQAMGMSEADTLAMAPLPTEPGQNTQQALDAAQALAKQKGENYRGFDRTHLGAKGAALFSAMVARELSHTVPATAAYFKAEK